MAYSDGYKVSSYPSSFDGDKLKRNAFHSDENLLVISCKHPDLSWDQRELLIQIGEKFYGKLKAKRP